ncbi:glucosamine--fructose-6-phosphate aminotransferase (isomerizing) [Isoptericola sp. CG 20/1183]|uniref:Glutamine--fructose-6-phosphate aminotransferase [isomerizing] n=1 Tax=Isoptericola halotolerans TaxID=300560 RepID=A0ABX5EJW4_9MICO|nr:MULTISPECIES: glutamine--fructose-6-phosphate transaminase (isomerizing) [Isoptericola]PRZ02484.1 glucosamine--fructose-6-phosphate aminotransferase (isomerizing) [Isoptericola sp. CG 20/1183]PRZ09948.1 glucosamine--fructose-6-phosphate aminotransferase (isomerizing) [Isoptericola halotolerans]
MCGIVGYVGPQQAAPVLVEGLTRLEYRGYDSAGVAVLNPRSSANPSRVVRAQGRVRDLEAALPARLAGTTGIGHTRWATHGEPSERNAHPHTSADGRVHVVHNGIIDNFATLRSRLADDGVELTSDTDTEVVAHLVARELATGLSLEDAVRAAVAQIVGTYALAVLDTQTPERIVVARNGSPLLLGVGDGEMFVASDPAAIVRHTSQVVLLDDGDFATVTADGFHSFTDGEERTARAAVTIDLTVEELELDGHEHFMHKEIHEQPESVERMLTGRLDDRFGTAKLAGLNLEPRDLRRFERVKVLGCGSAYYVGQLGASMIEDLARIPADAEPASEFRYRNPIIEPSTLYVVVSQSGETADTLFAVREVQRKGGTVVGLVNAVGSSIAREVDGGVYLHAGPEVAVASTKALTHMSIGFALLALTLGRVHDLSFADGRRIIAGLRAIPGQIAEILAGEEALAAAAKELSTAPSLFFVGRVRGYPVAREGAQKFKEITYRHAEAYPTSELKHGPLALISPELPSVAIIPDDDLVERNITAAQEIRARGGAVVAITHPGVELGDAATSRIEVPRNEVELDPILLTIPTQLLGYHAAVALGEDVDRPRNLAKSVTVE